MKKQTRLLFQRELKKDKDSANKIRKKTKADHESKSSPSVF
jgi:hypothetical protein